MFFSELGRISHMGRQHGGGALSCGFWGVLGSFGLSTHLNGEIGGKGVLFSIMKVKGIIRNHFYGIKMNF